MGNRGKGRWQDSLASLACPVFLDSGDIHGHSRPEKWISQMPAFWAEEASTRVVLWEDAVQVASPTGPDTPSLDKVRGYTHRLHTGPCCTGWWRYIRCWVPSPGSCQHRWSYFCNGGMMLHLSDSKSGPGPWAGPTSSKMPGLPPLDLCMAAWIVFERLCMEGDHIPFSVFCGGNIVVSTGVKHLSLKTALLLAGLACQDGAVFHSWVDLRDPLGRHLFDKLSGNSGDTISNRETSSGYYKEESFTIYHNHSSWNYMSEASHHATLLAGQWEEVCLLIWGCYASCSIYGRYDYWVGWT